ncbi:tubulin/FtsZ family protein [Halarchaeum sp. P4]|uniref:tubulin/FtsZ family protein n=1 Tax=Halarchaeum sp. P4 TaxID=3421639 RepID=UPI003EB87DA0
MQLVLIGVGQAGGKLTDALLQRDAAGESSFVRDAVAINTARDDLRGLERVPEDNRYLVGQSRVSGHGVGGDNELAADIAREERAELVNAVDVATSEVDAVLVVAGLGGGTGSGIAPVLLEELQQLYTEPVYALGILPSDGEGGLYELNAARSLRTVRREADNTLLVDNGVWRASADSLDDAYATINEEVATRLGVLFGAGEHDADAQVAESVLDASEIINTLDGGGVSAIGHTASPIERDDDVGGRLGGLLGSQSSVDDTTAVNQITSAIRSATYSQLSLPCDLTTVGRALVLVSGPPEWLSRKGIERGRQWVEETTQCREVRGGDNPVPGADHVAATVLFANVRESERLDALTETATEAQRRQQDERTDDPDLMDDDRLDSLF